MNLPKPKYEVTDKNHRYTIAYADGRTVGPLKSVTGALNVIAKEALIPWAAKMAAEYFKTELLRLGTGALTPAVLEQIAADAKMAHRRKASEAADLGTACHDIFEAIIKGKEPAQIPEALVEPARDFKRWRLSTDIELIALEVAVASAKHKFGGRIDAVGYSKQRGGFILIDYKTSKSLEYGNEYSYQVGGYACALAEQYGIEVAAAEIVRFGKVPPYDSEARPVRDLAAAIDGFLLALNLSRSTETKLIGEPSFCTMNDRLQEAVAAPRTKKKISGPQDKQALGF